MLAPKTNIAFSGSMRKVWLVMLLVLSTATVLVLLVTDQLSRQRATAELDERLSRVAATRTAQLRQNIAALRSDILFLAMVPPVQGIVRGGASWRLRYR